MYNPDDECKAIIEKLRELCRQKGITSYALAKKAGISTSTMSCIMNGKTKPQIYTLMLLCNALGITINELFSGGMPEEKTAGQERISSSCRGYCESIYQMELSEEEEKILLSYRYLPQEKKEWLATFVDMLKQYKEEKSRS